MRPRRSWAGRRSRSWTGGRRRESGAGIDICDVRRRFRGRRRRGRWFLFLGKRPQVRRGIDRSRNRIALTLFALVVWRHRQGIRTRLLGGFRAVRSNEFMTVSKGWLKPCSCLVLLFGDGGWQTSKFGQDHGRQPLTVMNHCFFFLGPALILSAAFPSKRDPCTARNNGSQGQTWPRRQGKSGAFGSLRHPAAPSCIASRSGSGFDSTHLYTISLLQPSARVHGQPRQNGVFINTSDTAALVSSPENNQTPSLQD